MLGLLSGGRSINSSRIFLSRFFSSCSVKQKKTVAKPPPPLWGRVGSTLKCGVLGVPNVGKSSFFNALTKSSVPAENYPFCTIDPNESRVMLPDPRFDYLCDLYSPKSRVPSYLKVTDIAGLVKGAHEGKGLGNSFLSHVGGVDALFHVCRAFGDDNIAHVDGKIDPVRDLDTISEELRLKDYEYVDGRLPALKRVSFGSDPQKKLDYQVLCKAEELLSKEGRNVRLGQWSPPEIDSLNKHLLLSAKPVMYLMNVSEKEYLSDKCVWLDKVKAWIAKNDPHAEMRMFSASFESKLMEMEPNDADAYTKSSGRGSALPDIIQKGFRLLQLQSFFTVGPDEVRSWTIHRGTKAPQAAGRIHGDFEKGFVVAEVMKYDDLKKHGSEEKVKKAGRLMQLGRNYAVEDGDIVHFKINSKLISKKK